MSDSTITKQTGGIAVIGAVIGVGVSILLNAAYSSTPDGVDLTVPSWEHGLKQFAAPLLTFAPAVETYHFYGRLVFPVIVAFIVGLYGLYKGKLAASSEKIPGLQKWGYRIALTGLVLNLFGNLSDYWVNAGETINFLAFLAGTFLGFALVLIGTLLFGISGLRNASLPKPAAWALILWFPVSMALLVAGMQNLPATPVLALSLAWIVIGSSMVRSGEKVQPLHKQTI